MYLYIVYIQIIYNNIIIIYTNEYIQFLLGIII